jgi:MSHA biogenesis protein MshM
MLDADFVTAYIPNPLLEPRSLMLALADELECSIDRNIDQHQLIKTINLRLLELANQGKRVLLCIDEAQALPIETLEALRLLSNLETEKRKLLQIVLFGQPELDRKLARSEIRQLTQRISFHYQLQALSADEINIYVGHRLAVAGYSGPTLFSSAALIALKIASGGVPRMVNVLAHKSLMLCFGEGKDRISAWHVVMAAKDTLAVKQLHFHASRLKFLAGVLGFLGFLLLAVSTMLGWMVVR